MVARWELEKGEVEIRCVPFFAKTDVTAFTPEMISLQRPNT